MILKWCFIVSLLFKELLFENYPVKQYVFERKNMLELLSEGRISRVEITVKTVGMKSISIGWKTRWDEIISGGEIMVELPKGVVSADYLSVMLK